MYEFLNFIDNYYIYIASFLYILAYLPYIYNIFNKKNSNQKFFIKYFIVLIFAFLFVLIHSITTKNYDIAFNFDDDSLGAFNYPINELSKGYREIAKIYSQTMDRMIKDFNRNSSFKKNIFICGHTEKLSDLIQKKNYLNLKFK